MATQVPPAPLVLVIGATGSSGCEIAAAFLRHGWRVRALHRDPETGRKAAGDLDRAEWVKGDAMVAADVIAAARGARIIVHAGNPPGYAGWARLLPQMMEAVIAAARATGARILFPGNVYNFGPDAWPLLTETSPQHPVTRKGKIRVALETRLAEVARSEGVRSLVVRAGDFFGSRAGSSWLTEGLVAKDTPLKSGNLAGPAVALHDWAYLPDLAETMVQLAKREAELEPFAVFHHRGHVLTNGELADAVERLAGHRLARGKVPWAVINLASPFVEMFKEMAEMRYLWNKDIVMDNSRLVTFLGREPHTPIDAALRRTLEGQGCLKPALKQAA